MRQLNHATKLFLICSNFLVQIQSFGINTRKAGDTIIHLNHAGASPSPPSVLDTVIQHMKLEQQLGGYAAARMRETELQQVYRNVARLVHAPSSQDIALVESATVAWTRLFYSNMPPMLWLRVSGLASSMTTGQCCPFLPARRMESWICKHFETC
jgi:hypothetical protein